MTQAVGAYHSITADKQFQYLETLRSKARHDEAQAISNAERKRDEHWQSVVDEQAARIAELEAKLSK